MVDGWLLQSVYTVQAHRSCAAEHVRTWLDVTSKSSLSLIVVRMKKYQYSRLSPGATMASLYTIKGILILDNDGERILCKVSVKRSVHLRSHSHITLMHTHHTKKFERW